MPYKVEASETLKIIGNDLIKMSDQLAFKDIVLKYGGKKQHRIRPLISGLQA